MVLRRVVPSALVNEEKVVIEGEPNERLPSGYTYISPTGRVYDEERGDTIRDLPPDVAEVPKTTWLFKFWRSKQKTLRPFPFPKFNRLAEAKELWYEKPEGARRLKAEYLEMKRYFGDFELFKDDSGSLLWIGRMDGIGEVQILYPSEYPKGILKVFMPNATEIENVEVNERIAKSQTLNITPASILIIVMMHFLAKGGKEKCNGTKLRKE